MTYIFVRHRRDGKYEVRFNAEQTQDYRRMLLSLKTYFPVVAREYNSKLRTWLIEDKSGNEVDRWRAKMVEELNPLMEFVCERQDVWEAAIQESYRTLHVLPSAPWDVVHGAYLVLGALCRTTDAGPDQLERINVAYERLRQEFEKDDSAERRSGKSRKGKGSA
jgi:hypothetical protein